MSSAHIPDYMRLIQHTLGLSILSARIRADNSKTIKCGYGKKIPNKLNIMKDLHAFINSVFAYPTYIFICHFLSVCDWPCLADAKT